MQAHAEGTEAVAGATKTRGRKAAHASACVAALFSAAVIVQASLDQSPQQRTESAAAPQTALSLDPASVVGVLNASFTPGGIRNRPRYPMEFEAILGPTSVSSFDIFASAAWPEGGATALASAPAAAGRRTSVAQACPSGGCRARSDVRLADARAVLPPARPALLLPPVVVADAGSPPVRAELAEERRVQFLGVKLPGFVPNGRAIVSTVVSWGGSVADLVPRI